jgi:hypothetical protein
MRQAIGVGDVPISANGGDVIGVGNVPISANGGTAIADASGGVNQPPPGDTFGADAASGNGGVAQAPATGGVNQPPPGDTFGADAASGNGGVAQAPATGGALSVGDITSGVTLDPNLLDPIAPGATLDTGLVDRITQSPELVNLLNQNPSVAEALEQNPTLLYQIEQHLGVGEQQWSIEPSTYTPTDYTDWGLTAPSLADLLDTVGQDVHEHDDFFEGI